MGILDNSGHYKAILRGEIPLDETDEGLEAVELSTGYQQMYDFFSHAINTYETALARDYFLGKRDKI